MINNLEINGRKQTVEVEKDWKSSVYYPGGNWGLQVQNAVALMGHVVLA